MTLQRRGPSPWFNVLYLVFAVAILAGVVMAVPIETRPMPYVEGMFNAIDALPEGSKVFWPVTGWPYSFYTAKLTSGQIIKHVLAKNLKLVVHGGQGPLVNMHDKIMALGTGYDDISDHPGYGTQFIDLGVLPGRGDAQILSLIEGFDQLTQVDMFGTPLEDLPLYQEFQSCKDAVAIFALGRRLGIWRSQLPDAIYVGVTSSSTGIIYGTNELYVTGLIEGFVAGIKQGGQYEQLSGHTVGAKTLLFAEMIVGAFIVGGMIIGNGYWLYNKYVRGKEEEAVVTVVGDMD
jgi:hypothetical protein